MDKVHLTTRNDILLVLFSFSTFLHVVLPIEDINGDAVESPSALIATSLNATHINVSWVEEVPKLSPTPALDMLVTDDNATEIAEPTTEPSPHLVNKSSYSILFRSNDFDWKAAVIAESGDTWVVVGGLNPYTAYKFRRVADNDASIANESNWTTTDMTVPSGAPVIDNNSVETNSHSVVFEFGPPERSQWNGDLDGYTLTYTHLKSKKMMSKMIAIDDKRVNISGLEAYSEYSIELSAHNPLGNGPPALISFSTEEGVPNQPRISRILSRSDTSMYLGWEPPKQPNGVLIGYRIYVSTNGAQLFMFNVTVDNRLHYYVTGLEPFTGYDLQVSALTSVGEGARSDVYPVMTM